MCWPARDSTHIPTRQSVVSFIANGSLPQGDSVTHVAVPIPYDPEEVEAECQQSRAQQVTQRCQVRDGETVGIFAIPPHGVHHPVCYTQQQQHLQEKQRAVRLLSHNTRGRKTGHVFYHMQLIIYVQNYYLKQQFHRLLLLRVLAMTYDRGPITLSYLYNKWNQQNQKS